MKLKSKKTTTTTLKCVAVEEHMIVSPFTSTVLIYAMVPIKMLTLHQCKCLPSRKANYDLSNTIKIA